MHSPNAKMWRAKAKSQTRNFCTTAHLAGSALMVTAVSPSALCSGFQPLSPSHAPHSRRQGPEEGTFSVPPCPCLLPGLPRKPRARAPGFGEGTPSAEPLPSPNPEECEVQGNDPSCMQLPPSSRRHLRWGRVGKGSERRTRCPGGFICPPPWYFYQVSVSLPLI